MLLVINLLNCMMMYLGAWSVLPYWYRQISSANTTCAQKDTCGSEGAQKLAELTKLGTIRAHTKDQQHGGNYEARLCIDPRDLNKAIKRPKYQMSTL